VTETGKNNAKLSGGGCILTPECFASGKLSLTRQTVGLSKKRQRILGLIVDKLFFTWLSLLKLLWN